MTSHFHSLHIREIRRETAETVSIAFDVPEELRAAFHFIPGQYLTLRTTIDGADIRRSYSICSAPHENELRVAIKKEDGGVFSTFANERLRAGDVLQVMPPQGRFSVDLNPENNKTYVAFAVGSGITPVISILKSTLVQEPHSRFLLFYGNRGFDHIVFREQLEALKNRYPERLAVHHVLSRESLGSELFFGRINSDKCQAYARYFFQPQAVDHFFLCGPETMVFEVKETLEQLGVAAQKIHFELFTTAGMQQKRADKPAASASKNSFDASVTVIQDGVQFDFLLPSDGSTLLDAAMRAGADLPFSCKGGVCSTCKARILDGQVDMEVSYGLEADEIAAGYVLTCQSHPTTKRVVVSFDA